MTIRVLLLSAVLAGFPQAQRVESAGCPNIRSRGLLGLGARSLTLEEMVKELERGCLALNDVETLPPSQLAMVARALGLARGAYRVAVPAEAGAGLPPDTLQARRRGLRVREQLVYYGAAASRLLEDPTRPTAPAVVAPGTAVPMLIRVPAP